MNDTHGAALEEGLAGYRSNEEWQDLLAQTAAMLADLENIEDADVRRDVFNALAGVDALHREALHRLVRLFKEGVLEQVVTDPAIHSLMGMYGLLPPETPACQKIWDFTDGGAADAAGQGVDTAGSVPPQSHWTPVPADATPEEGGAYLCAMDEGPVLLIRAEGADYALAGVCPVHGGGLETGRLDGVMWHCPHGPGCSYDIRSGKRLGGGDGLVCFPVRSEAGTRRMIGFGIPYEPKLPAF